MKNKLVVHKTIIIIFTVLWMGVIFAFSSRPADVSAKDSHAIGMAIGAFIVPDFEQLSAEEQLAFAEKVDHPVRKTAHATEYAILGWLMFLLCSSWTGNDRKGLRVVWLTLLPWLISTIYAASDEFHQTFVQGRSGQVSDVCLDSMGALVGVVIGLYVLYRVNCKREKRR